MPFDQTFEKRTFHADGQDDVGSGELITPGIGGQRSQSLSLQIGTTMWWDDACDTTSTVKCSMWSS
jgi:hypothetical protein